MVLEVPMTIRPDMSRTRYPAAARGYPRPGEPVGSVEALQEHYERSRACART